MTRVPRHAEVPGPEALLAAERDLVPTPEEVRRRVLSRARGFVVRRLPLPAVVSVPRRKRSSPAWLAAAMVLCGAAAYAGYRVGSLSPPAPAPVPAAALDPSGSAAISASTVASPAASPSSLVPAPGVAGLAGVASDAPPAVSSVPTRPVPATESEAYALELAVLLPAQRATAREDYAAALAAVREHHRRFPEGRLAEEREALRVKALVGLGRAGEAQRAGAAFHERFPRSALRNRMDEMLERPR